MASHVEKPRTFIEALTQGTSREVTRCLADGASVNALLYDDHQAVSYGPRSPLEWALSRDRSVNLDVDPDMFILVETLLSAGADIHQISRESHFKGNPRPVWASVFHPKSNPYNNEKLFRLLWKYHPELSFINQKESLHPDSHPWVLSSAFGCLSLLKDFLAITPKGSLFSDKSVVMILASRPMMWGEEGLSRLISLVPESMRSDFSFTVLVEAITAPQYLGDSLPIVKWAYSRSPDFSVESLDLCIEKAAQRNNAEAMLHLFSARPSFSTHPWTRPDPLMVSASEGVLSYGLSRLKVPGDYKGDVLDMAISWGLSGNEPGPMGRTALHATLYLAPLILDMSCHQHRQHVEGIVGRLARAGASWNVPDENGQTPLSIAQINLPKLAARWERANAKSLATSIGQTLSESIPDPVPSKPRL